MTNINFETIEEYKDIAAINGYKKAQHEGEDIAKYMRNLKANSRDNSRRLCNGMIQPMSFSKHEPWISVNNNKKEINVMVQDENKNSVLNHFRSLTGLRKENPVLVHGAYQPLLTEHDSVFAYKGN